VNVAAHITRRVEIATMQLMVVDGLFSDQDIRSLYGFLRDLPYQLNDIASDETAHVKHWKADFPRALAEATPVLRDCIRTARALMVDERYMLDRCYTNMILYGDSQGPHTDPREGITALYYANPEWKDHWLGETIFYDERREPVHAVGVKPGRLAIFHSDILHRAGVPSRECFEPRLSVAFTFVPR
jgi:2OG-Fe(II) oxygenase superfamily